MVLLVLGFPSLLMELPNVNDNHMKFIPVGTLVPWRVNCIYQVASLSRALMSECPYPHLPHLWLGSSSILLSLFFCWQERGLQKRFVR